MKPIDEAEAHRAPIHALADSQLLFWRTPQGPLFLTGLIERTCVSRPLAVYVGASNGHRPEFYREIFEPAMRAAAVALRARAARRPAGPGQDAAAIATTAAVPGSATVVGTAIGAARRATAGNDRS